MLDDYKNQDAEDFDVLPYIEKCKYDIHLQSTTLMLVPWQMLWMK